MEVRKSNNPSTSASTADKFAFAESGRRGTRQRRALRDCLNSSDTFVSAQQIHETLAANGEQISLSTVYRTLQAMAQAGEIDQIHTGTGEALYRKCETAEKHHHLTCTECGYAIELRAPAIERWTQSAARQNGFSDVACEIELFGICQACTN